MDIGLLVRDRRRAAGWSQAALAERVGSSRQWVVDLERGNAGAEVGRVLEALAVLGVGLDAQVAFGVADGAGSGVPTTATSPERGVPEGGESDAPGTSGRWPGMPSLDEVLGERSDPPSRADARGWQNGPPPATADRSAARGPSKRAAARTRGAR